MGLQPLSLLVTLKKPTLLDVVWVGSNGDVGDPQEMFLAYAYDLSAVEILGAHSPECVERGSADAVPAS